MPDWEAFGCAVAVYGSMSAEDIKKVVDASIEFINAATEKQKGV